MSAPPLVIRGCSLPPTSSWGRSGGALLDLGVRLGPLVPLLAILPSTPAPAHQLINTGSAMRVIHFFNSYGRFRFHPPVAEAIAVDDRPTSEGTPDA